MTTKVCGTGFVANATVALAWTVGIPATTVTRADAGGSFCAELLVLPGDQLGPPAGWGQPRRWGAAVAASLLLAAAALGAVLTGTGAAAAARSSPKTAAAAP